jgi:predicted O-methyltransferase YrrM
MNVIYPSGLDGEVTRREAEIIAHFAWQQRGKYGIALEIGTFQGSTTENIAANFDGMVLTVDLPLNTVSKLESSPDNDKYHNAPKKFSNPRIEQILCDSADLKIVDPIAFAFIDGCHTEAYCINDFEKIEPHMIDGGIVLFHDYGKDCWPGVTAGIAKLMQKYAQHFWSHLTGTSIVCCTVSQETIQ